MERRSTNANGYTHFQYDVTAHVGSSHGVRLSGGSTGGIVEAVGDDTNISLTVRGQGSGAVSVGSSGQTVFVAGSTAPWGGLVRYLDTAVSTPVAFNDTECGRVAETTHVLVGASSITAGGQGHFITANSVNLPAAVGIAGAYIGSTGNDVHVRFVKGSTVAVAATTCTVQFLLTRF